MADKITILGIDPAQVPGIMHGLAHMRIPCNMSKIRENYDNPFHVPRF